MDAYNEFGERFDFYGSALRDPHLANISYICSQQHDRLSTPVLGPIRYAMEDHTHNMHILLVMDDFSHSRIESRIEHLQRWLDNRKNGVHLSLPFDKSDERRNLYIELGLE